MRKRVLLSLVLIAMAVGCGSSRKPGNMLLTWALEDQVTGDPVSCAAGDKVVVTATPNGSGTQFIDRFDCTLMGGTTNDLDGGNYTVTVQLVDANGAAVSQPVTFNHAVSIDNNSVDLGHFVFQV